MADIPVLPWPTDLPWNDRTYDAITLGARQWPGLATIDIKRANKIDKKGAKGQAGAKLTFQGRQPAEVMITIIVWDPADMEAMMQGLTEIEPPEKKDPKPVDVIHPVAFMRGLKAIAVEELDGPKWDKKSKWWEVKIKACEFLPPSPGSGNATKTPTAAEAASDAADKEAFNKDREDIFFNGPAAKPPANTGPGPGGSPAAPPPVYPTGPDGKD